MNAITVIAVVDFHIGLQHCADCAADFVLQLPYGVVSARREPWTNKTTPKALNGE